MNGTGVFQGNATLHDVYASPILGRLNFGTHAIQFYDSEDKLHFRCLQSQCLVPSAKSNVHCSSNLLLQKIFQLLQ